MGMYDCRVRRESLDAPFIRRHEYDPGSGWCYWGCGCRSDGRVIRMKDGKVIQPGPTYTPAQLDDLRAWFEQHRPRTPSPRFGNLREVIGD